VDHIARFAELALFFASYKVSPPVSVRHGPQTVVSVSEHMCI
jgi:hypothetical protein